MIVGLAPLVASIRLIILIGRRKARSIARQLLWKGEKNKGLRYYKRSACMRMIIDVAVVALTRGRRLTTFDVISAYVRHGVILFPSRETRLKESA